VGRKVTPWAATVRAHVGSQSATSSFCLFAATRSPNAAVASLWQVVKERRLLHHIMQSTATGVDQLWGLCCKAWKPLLSCTHMFPRYFCFHLPTLEPVLKAVGATMNVSGQVAQAMVACHGMAWAGILNAHMYLYSPSFCQCWRWQCAWACCHADVESGVDHRLSVCCAHKLGPERWGYAATAPNSS